MEQSRRGRAAHYGGRIGMLNKKRGRPRKGEQILSRSEILERALTLVLDRGREVGVREIARSLGVDPMALYHYFADKDALYEALVAHLVDKVYRPRRTPDWRGELEALMMSYLQLLAGHRGVLRTILRLASRAKGPAQMFRRRFETAVASLDLSAADGFTAMSAAVDFVHGFAAALEYAEEGTLTVENARGSIRVVTSGIASLSRRTVHIDE